MILEENITKTEAKYLIGMVQNYLDLYSRGSHIFASREEADRGCKYNGITH